MKRATKVICLAAVILFSLGITVDYSRAVEPEEQKQSIAETAPPLPNGINIGGVSIGITKLVREKNITLVHLVFRCINENLFPRDFWLCITDDRGNTYKSNEARHYKFFTSPRVGSTWTLDSPFVIKIPEIAPIANLELITDRESIPEELRGVVSEQFTLGYQKITPLPVLDLSLKIKPSQMITRKEIRQGEHISLWFGEARVTEKTTQDKSPEKTIFINVPMVIENRDYNSRRAQWKWETEFQLNSGRIISDGLKYKLDNMTLDNMMIKAVSKNNVELSCEATVEKDEQVQLVWLNQLPPDIPMPGILPIVGGSDRSPKFFGLLYALEKVTPSEEIVLPILPPRRLVSPDIQDGDWFPDGSMIVFSKKTKTKDTEWHGEKVLSRIFVMNSDEGNEKEISIKQAPQEIIKEIGYEDHVAPLVSPDSQKIAFVVGREDHPLSIFIMDTDGGNIRRMSPDSYDSLVFAWISNDKIVFWENKPNSDLISDSDIDIVYNRGRIYILDINNGDIRKLKTPPPELLRGKSVRRSIILTIVDLQKTSSLE